MTAADQAANRINARMAVLVESARTRKQLEAARRWKEQQWVQTVEPLLKGKTK